MVLAKLVERRCIMYSTLWFSLLEGKWYLIVFLFFTVKQIRPRVRTQTHSVITPIFCNAAEVQKFAQLYVSSSTSGLIKRYNKITDEKKLTTTRLIGWFSRHDLVHPLQPIHIYTNLQREYFTERSVLSFFERFHKRHFLMFVKFKLALSISAYNCDL